MEPAKPPGFENYLSSFAPVVDDPYCGEPVAWGFKIITYLGEDLFRELGKHGRLECVDGFNSSWALIVKTLTREDAVEKYGIISNEVFGPRGGWKSTTFGDKTFCHRFLRPEK
ncbi:hypothetical protein [Niabella sp.]|uniref:hypothetical protein n=1 Tax=Niabella sp. TaxID=1962976 RepID=UPI002627E998|nr:hypothetical protein [Niabella sp.]